MQEEPEERRLMRLLKPYAEPSVFRSLFQIVNTVVPLAGLWLLMLASLDYSYFITLALAVPAAGLLVRIFIFQHDCGHGSFFASRRANDLLGFFLGILTLTPYGYWRKTHALHHANSGNLDIRTFGDIRILTVAEYRARKPWGRFLYRLYRHPFVLFGIGPPFQFLIKHRFPLDVPFTWKREWRSVMLTNIGIAVVATVVSLVVGVKTFLMVQLPISLIAGVAGVWLFYIQHQFEDTYWRRKQSWRFHEASLEGSSYYDLPAFLHWFTGNIGVHHVHHLSPRIPNYRLLACFRQIPEMQEVTRLTLWSSLRCAGYRLWDEERKQLVGFRALRLN